MTEFIMTKSSPARVRKRTTPITLPIAEHPGVIETDIFPTLDEMWHDFTSRPFFKAYSRETQQVIKYAYCTAVAETLRTIAFSMNMEGNDAVFDRFAKELDIYDRELVEAFRDHS